MATNFGAPETIKLMYLLAIASWDHVLKKKINCLIVITFIKPIMYLSNQIATINSFLILNIFDENIQLPLKLLYSNVIILSVFGTNSNKSQI